MVKKPADYERYYDASPGRVFSVLLKALPTSGFVEGVSDHGSSVTFALAGSKFDVAPTLTAKVQPSEHGTLLKVRQTRPEEWVSLEDDHHFLHLLELLKRVSDVLGSAEG